MPKKSMKFNFSLNIRGCKPQVRTPRSLLGPVQPHTLMGMHICVVHTGNKVMHTCLNIANVPFSSNTFMGFCGRPL